MSAIVIDLTKDDASTASTVPYRPPVVNPNGKGFAAYVKRTQPTLDSDSDYSDVSVSDSESDSGAGSSNSIPPAKKRACKMAKQTCSFLHKLSKKELKAFHRFISAWTGEERDMEDYDEDDAIIQETYEIMEKWENDAINKGYNSKSGSFNRGDALYKITRLLNVDR